ncbi:MAG TPA: glycoside hydrolase family 44 protein [Ktedonobacteraceae bacterium]|nr:glycoside hydrolase family 44 protein [Ktedonobacteraceae bacterium]
MISGRPNNSQAPAPLGWKDLTQGTSPSRNAKGRVRRRVIIIVSVLLLVLLIFASVRVVTVASDSNDQLLLQIGSQQQAVIDLRQSEPISPYLFGTNVFPEQGTLSVDSRNNNYTGFMSYGPQVVSGLQNAGVKLLRFPGGSWGENEANQNHILSCQQLYDFSQLLYQTGADGMIQARLSNPIDATGQAASLAERANLAGRWVDYMSNPKSTFCTGAYAEQARHPVKFWSVGNEPDRLNNPDTNKPYTVADYVKAFIAYSTQMHKNNPNIKVFGPEISQFNGVGIGPKDSQGYLWMDDFLKGVGQFEQANHVTLLDGVSFHFYPFGNAGEPPSSSLLLSSTEEWNYLLPPLRQLIRQDLGRDVPIAVTEVNTTSSNGQSPTRGQAALWWADTLGEMMNQQVEYAAYFSTEGVEPPYPLFNNDGKYSQTAMFRVMQMFTHLQSNLIPLSIQREPIGVYATQDDAHSAVSLLFINKSGNNELAHISPANTAFGVSSWQSLDISLKGYSMTLVTLHHSSGADAWYFDVPTVDQPGISPLQQVTCGNKTDPLAYDIPC